MKCAVNLGVSFAQDNIKSRIFHSKKTNSKIKWEKKNDRSIKLHVPVSNVPVIGGSYTQTSTFYKTIVLRENTQ